MSLSGNETSYQKNKTESLQPSSIYRKYFESRLRNLCPFRFATLYCLHTSFEIKLQDETSPLALTNDKYMYYIIRSQHQFSSVFFTATCFGCNCCNQAFCNVDAEKLFTTLRSTQFFCIGVQRRLDYAAETCDRQ